MVRFSFMRDCGSIPHGDSTASTFSSNFLTITSLKSTLCRRSYIQQSSKSSIYPTILDVQDKKEGFKHFDSKLTLQFAISSFCKISNLIT